MSQRTDLSHICIILCLFLRPALPFLSVCKLSMILLKMLDEDDLLPELGFELMLGCLEHQQLMRC